MSEKEEKKVLNDEELEEVNGGAVGNLGGQQGSNQAVNGSFAQQVVSGTNANQGASALGQANAIRVGAVGGAKANWLVKMLNAFRYSSRSNNQAKDDVE